MNTVEGPTEPPGDSPGERELLSAVTRARGEEAPGTARSGDPAEPAAGTLSVEGQGTCLQVRPGGEPGPGRRAAASASLLGPQQAGARPCPPALAALRRPSPLLRAPRGLCPALPAVPALWASGLSLGVAVRPPRCDHGPCRAHCELRVGSSEPSQPPQQNAKAPHVKTRDISLFLSRILRIHGRRPHTSKPGSLDLRGAAPGHGARGPPDGCGRHPRGRGGTATLGGSGHRERGAAGPQGLALPRLIRATHRRTCRCTFLRELPPHSLAGGHPCPASALLAACNFGVLRGGGGAGRA